MFPRTEVHTMRNSVEIADSSLLRQIRSLQPDLGSAMQRVAEYVLRHPERVIYLSVTEMAAECNVGEATVIRFCQQLNLSGYQDFKIKLSQSLVEPLKSLHAVVEPDDSPKQVLDKVFQTTIVTLRDTQSVIDDEQLVRAVEILSKAARIEFVGCGGSGVVAMDAYHKFMKLGIPCGASPDAHNARQVCSVLRPGDAVVAISYSGATRDTLRAVEIAKEAGAQVVALTRFGRTPLSQLGDAVLHTSSPESRYRAEGYYSRIAQLCIIDALFVGVYLTDENRFLRALSRTRNSLTDTRL